MTIRATATPPGEGGVAVVRVSGPRTREIVGRLVSSIGLPRQAVLRTFHDPAGRPLDQGLLLWFPGPASYTGEDMAELHLHGSPMVVSAIEDALGAFGARAARPGEFTERAFLNGRMDLTQAEGVARLIQAESVEAARSAFEALDGAPRRRLEALATELLHLRAELEAELDFPDEEDVPRMAQVRRSQRLGELRDALADEHARASSGHQQQSGARLAVIGPANAGKSSLVNALLGEDRAIVHEQAGTTRDVVQAGLVLGGRRLELLDTAGLRSGQDIDPVEREGHQRALAAAARAGHVLLVEDDSEPNRGKGAWEAALGSVDPSRCTRIQSKIDLSGGPAGVREIGPPPWIGVSAHTGAGLEVLRDHLRGLAGSGAEAGAWAASTRHLDHLQAAVDALDDARTRHAGDVELICSGLRTAQDELGALTGEVTSEDVLGEIFAGFCIGK